MSRGSLKLNRFTSLYSWKVIYISPRGLFTLHAMYQTQGINWFLTKYFSIDFCGLPISMRLKNWMSCVVVQYTILTLWCTDVYWDPLMPYLGPIYLHYIELTPFHGIFNFYKINPHNPLPNIMRCWTFYKFLIGTQK